MKDSERGREEEKGSLFAERSRRIRECVLERIDFSAEVSDERVLELIDEEITLFASEEEVLVSEMKRKKNALWIQNICCRTTVKSEIPFLSILILKQAPTFL